jgi:hypothetical protein
MEENYRYFIIFYDFAIILKFSHFSHYFLIIFKNRWNNDKLQCF